MNRLAALACAAVSLAACSDNPTSTTTATLAVQPVATSSAPVSAPIPGQYIVVFKNNVLNAAAMASTIAVQHKTTIRHTYSSALKGVALALSAAEADAMRANPNVAYVEQDQTVKLTSTQTNAPWNLDRTDQRALPLNSTYVSSADGTGVTVYIIDSGINYAHVEFGGRAVPGADFITPSLNGDDCVGHGTGVASVVGGTTYGVAKNARLVSLRVVDCALNISSSKVIAAIDWIAAHPSLPSVVNMSMQLNKSLAVQQAIQNSINSGVVYAVAAGNSADDACNWTPANVPAVLTVAASDDTDGFASFSSFGSCVDLAAPGTGINTAWIGSSTAAHQGGGTSYSSPLVAGIAALYLQANPSATPAQVSAALTSNATSNALANVPANTPNKLAYSAFISAGPVPPVANFTANCSTMTCSFDASGSTALATATYSWTFGDATSGSGKTPSHTYASSGTDVVTLTVTDANGSSATTKIVTIVASNQSPVARFTASCPAMQCTFDASGSSDDVGIVSYRWTWGDGRGETRVSSIVRNTYAAAATYNVTLTVTDGGGLVNSVTKAVQVPTSTNTAPTASIASPANGASVVQGTSVAFSGTGSDPQDGTLSGSSLTWTSSVNGQIGTGTSFSTSTLSVGSHVITLTARDAQGLLGTATSTLTVTAPAPVNTAPTASITLPANGASVVQGTSVAFSGTGSDPQDGTLSGSSLTWTSSVNGQIGTGTSFSTSTLSVGSHVITLTARDAQGLTGTATSTLTVTAPPPPPPTNQPPVARFTWTCGAAGSRNCTMNGSTSTDDVAIVSYTWDWGNGRSEVRVGSSATNTWATAGTYNITLTVKDGSGLTGSVAQTVVVP